MRNSILLLILANLCLGLWVYSKESSRQSADALPPENPQVRKLLLLSELADSINPSDTARSSETNQTAPANSKPSPQEIKQTVFDPEPQKAQPKPKEPSKSTQDAPSTASNTDAQTKKAEQKDASPAQPLVTFCYTYGPFDAIEKARKAIRLLSKARVSVTRRSIQEQEAYGFRVFIPPLQTRQIAYDVASELRKNGIKDYFVITNPNDKVDGISLGLFTKKASAIKRVAQLRNLGYQADIEIRYREKELFWLDYEAQPNQISDTIFNEASEGSSGVQLLKKSC